MNFLEKLDALKAQSGDNNLTLSKKTGIPASTIYGLYKKGYENMQLSTLQSICDYFNVSLDYLAKDGEASNANSAEALRIAADYDALDPHGRRAVRAVLDVEIRRVTEEASRPALTVKLLHFSSPSAAGEPMDADSDSEYIERPASIVPDGSDFTVKLSGHSMEPDFPDGCTAFVRRTFDIDSGDVVIAWLDGGMVCKRAVLDGTSIVRLESINRAYDDYSGAALENMRIYGKVTGKTMG